MSTPSENTVFSRLPAGMELSDAHALVNDLLSSARISYSTAPSVIKDLLPLSLADNDTPVALRDWLLDNNIVRPNLDQAGRFALIRGLDLYEDGKVNKDVLKNILRESGSEIELLVTFRGRSFAVSQPVQNGPVNNSRRQLKM